MSCVETATKGKYTIKKGSSISLGGLFKHTFDKDEKHDVDSHSEKCTCPEGESKVKEGSITLDSKGTHG